MSIKVNIEYIHRLKRGDVEAFEHIFHAYYPQVYKFTSSTLYDKNFAEDITQSVFIALWENREHIDTDKNLASFLYTIAKNKIYRQTERMILETKHQEYLRDNSFGEMAYIEEEIHNKFLEKIIFDLVEDLPDSRRKIFLLSRKHGFTNKEIASQLKISEKTVETQIRRSVAYLKEKLKYIYLLFF